MSQIGFLLVAAVVLSSYVIATRQPSSSSSLEQEELPVITIKNGSLRGFPLTSTDGRQFLSFRGIPYAKPPVGSLRFQPPEPAEPWSGILDAIKDGDECPQVDYLTGRSKGNESCLFLNVYTPEDYVGKQLPVMVFIHGGGFLMGTGNSYLYSPIKLMDLDVVLVAFNHRLGMLGFMSTDDENAPGNYGMLDQVQVLQWVQENIHKFGGNKNKVLVFGVSAGGGSVSHLVLSNLTTGLFHAAIAQSGTAASEWSIQRKPLMWAQKVGAVMNCSTTDTKELVDCFRNASVEDLIIKSASFHIAIAFPMYFLPVVEVRGGRGFLTEDPLEALKAGRIANRVPFITGVVQDEGFLSSYLMEKSFKSKGQQFVDVEFPSVYLPTLAGVEPNMRNAVHAIQTEYWENRDVNDTQEFLDGFQELLADTMFLVAADETLKYMAKAGIPTYAYRYTFESRQATAITSQFLGVSAAGKVTHGEETSALFRVQFFPNATQVNDNDDDKFMQNLMTTVWRNFADIQEPSFVGTPVENRTLRWVPYDADQPNYMQLNTTPTMKTGQLSTRTSFWTETVPRLIRESETQNKNEL